MKCIQITIRELRITILLSILISLPFLAFAGVNKWTSSGPAGGGILGFTFDPRNAAVIFAIDGPNLYKSTNRGGTWSRLPVQFIGINKIQFSPHNSKELFISVYSTLLKSNNQGISWKVVGDMPSNSFLIDFTFHPTLPSVIYGLCGAGFVRSVDSGRNWEIRNTGLPLESNSIVFDIEVDPNNGESVYLAIDRSIFKTTNGGNSWSRLSTIDAYNASSIKKLLIDPKNSSILYAAIGESVFKSIDGGKKWQQQTSFYGDVTHLSIDLTQTDTLYAAGQSLQRTQDGGVTWDTVRLPSRHQYFIDSLEVHPMLPGVVFVGDRANGIFKTQNGGDTWNVVNNGLNSTHINEIEAASSDRLFAIGRNNFQLYQKRSSQPKWSLLESIITDRVEHISVHPKNPDLIAVAGYFGGSYEGPNVAVSNDGGTSWRFSRALESAASGTETLQFHSHNQNILFLSVFNTHGAYAGIARSLDQGRTWKLSNAGLTNPRVFKIIVSPDPGSPIFARSGPPSQFFRSENAGANWQQVILPWEPAENSADIKASRNILYALTYTNDLYSYVYSSSNNGRSWIRRATLPPDNGLRIVQLEVAPDQPSVLFAFNPYGRKLFRSVDSGRTWTQFPRPQLVLYDFLINPFDFKNYLMATSQGVYSYTNTK